MKAVKLGLIFTIAALITLGLGSAAFAFHGGGVAHCDGCHTIHNSDGGDVVNDSANSQLLVGADPSSACLTCHDSIYMSMSADGSAFTPGGDFYWLSVENKPAHGSTVYGNARGHSIVASDFSLDQDTDLTIAPGGVYTAANMGCNSCHDPHGKIANNTNPDPISVSGSYGGIPAVGSTAGNFRLLGGVGYDGGEGVDGISFDEPAPVARAYPGSRGQWPAETDGNHVDYGSGMSEWCGNCHGNLISGGSISHRHPASDDSHLNGFSTAYNQYVATGELTGTSATSFDRLVPFERGITDRLDLALDYTSTAGPNSNSNVMCLTCHRAHASAFPKALRWEMAEELLADSAFVVDNPNAYYGEAINTRYNEFQRSLCNKCHVQD